MSKKKNKMNLVKVEKELEKREPSLLDFLQIIILGVILVFCFIYLFKDYLKIPLIIK